MSNRKSCIKCGRGIDEFARVCPYCNWWQSQPLPAHQPAMAIPAHHAALDPRTQKGLLGVLACGFLLMVAFTLGSLFHGATPAKAAAAQQPPASAPATPSTPHVSVTLIPVNEGAPLAAPDASITSVSPQNTTSTMGSDDATALPSQQYNAAAAKLQQGSQQATGTVVDPRSISGSPYQQPAPRPAARPRQPRPMTASVETQPIPLYQPVPHVRTDREVTAQLSLVVGTDGRVHDIDIQRAAPGVMGPLIGDVQQWRFRPATDGGQPVSSRFTVAVTFRP